MGQKAVSDVTPDDVLAFWFPPGLDALVPDDHIAFWRSRMQGGMDAAIIGQWADVTRAAARGALDHWADTATGRLALILALDQFSRSLWRDSPAAYEQDNKATLFALDGIDTGHFDALPHPWQKNFYLIAICHCEGPDHLERMDRAIALADAQVAAMPAPLRAHYGDMGNQPRRVRDIIRRFGRHPHRNPVYGRLSSPEEEVYIATGDFPHTRKIGPDD
ncbi:DUF924 domain-containing protein [Seohaeicola saemankumensis]|nr:DUF924 family protein [Seohaeicola saemankumensis]MCA0872673.1 DUF924 domain-containing protein [Seohaeicola saemankumensis]